jgi:hypothetical protein
MIRHLFHWFALSALLPCTMSDASWAAVVWTGPISTFSKASGADPTVPANQDHLTSLVSLARGTAAGMFNIAQEASFAATSPKDTQWATGFNNPSQTITASNFAALTFTTWQNAYGGGGALNGNITTNDAVVHLVTDDIYLNLRFTAFQGSGGGSFTYQRSTPAPEPAAVWLLLIGVPALVAKARSSRRSAR